MFFGYKKYLITFYIDFFRLKCYRLMILKVIK